MKSNFKFSPDILVRLGEELVPNPTDGLLELVKNAYDADASTCVIEIERNSIVIEDDGNGMTDLDISEGWLLIGGSRKKSVKATALGRIPVGNKGLGRLAALRLGRKATVISRPRSKPGVEFRITIDWDQVESSSCVEAAFFDIGRATTKKGKGTTIILEGLAKPLPREELPKLSKSLILLSDPFDNEAGFYASVQSTQFKELSGRAKQNYFADADFHLRAEVDSKGYLKAQVFDWKGDTMFSSIASDFKKRYKMPSATFDLWNFKLDGRSFSAKNSPMKDVRQWLKVVGGVHLYHRKMRVRPFGEAGYDWLEMDRKRAGSPEERPSTNNSVGQIKVTDLNELLTQKTDRSGFIENAAFLELKQFAIDALDWMARKRLAVAEDRREAKRSSVNPAVVQARAALEKKVLTTVPKKDQKGLLKALQNFETAKSNETSALREELQLYRSLATAGTTTAVFAHESQKPLTNILSISDSIKNRALILLGDIFHSKLEKPLQSLVNAAKALQAFSRLPLNMLRRDRRRAGVVDLSASAAELVSYLKPFFADAKIDLQLDRDKVTGKVQIMGSPALVDSILANLAMNSLQAFANRGGRTQGRRVVIRLETNADEAIVTVLDNGPGIQDIALEEIWLPGRTTSPDGTGFGLTIVRDSVTDLRGTRAVVANGELGGAEFKITLPLTQ